MKKIMILGCSGAGKSTLAKRLSDILHIQAIHLDAHYWRNGWTETSREEWNAKQTDLLTGDSWVIDGNYTNTIESRFAKADTIIYLDFPTIVCLYRVIKRRWQFRGRTRPDMAAGCREKIDWEFLSYVASFNRKKAPAIQDGIANLQNKKVIILKNRQQIEAFLKATKRIVEISSGKDTT